MAGHYVGRVAATLAIFLIVAASAGDDASRVGTQGVRDDDVMSATRRRQIQSLIYHVDEHLPVGSLVGDLGADLRSACDDGQLADCDDLPTRFSLLHQRPEFARLFDIHETTGVLRSSGVVDREEICFRREIVCSVVLEVAVHYSAVGAFDVAIVEVSYLYIYLLILEHRRRHGIKCGYAECEARRAESGGGVLGEGAAIPLPTS